MAKNEKLSRLKRCKVFGNGLVNSPDGNLCLYAEVHDLLRDETAGANVVIHDNPDPDGNEADGYTCITSDKINLCFTANQVREAAERYAKAPWNAKPAAKKPKRRSRKKAPKLEVDK